MLIVAAEFCSAVFACMLLWHHAGRRRMHDFATSVFLLCYAPLFCVYPLIGRVLSDGAISIHAANASTLTDQNIYLIYQGYNLVILTAIAILGGHQPHLKQPQTTAQREHRSATQLYYLVAGLFIGVYLYVYSTGLSIADLLVASRFEWFLNDNYSSFWSVVASYLVALTPAVVYLAARDGRRKTLAITLLLLIGYGALSKDRKWLIFIASGLIAAYYVRSKFQARISPRAFAWLLALALALAFWQIARGLIFNTIITGNTEMLESTADMAQQLLTKGDLPYYYNASATAIEMNLNENYSIPFGLLRRQLFFFIPVDYSLGLKIEDISAIFSDAVDGGDEVRRGNMPPGLIGLFVLSFQWWGGLLAALALPFALRLLDVYLRGAQSAARIAILSSYLSAVLLLLRGDDSSATYFIVFNLLALVIADQIIKYLPRISRTNQREHQKINQT